MNHSTTIQEIVEKLETFSPILQKQVLDFTLKLSDEIPEGPQFTNSLNSQVQFHLKTLNR